jgi:hypothetical protein
MKNIVRRKALQSLPRAAEEFLQQRASIDL